MTPEATRRLINLRRMWQQKYAAAHERGGHQAVALAAFDRARAVAKTAEKRGDPDIWRQIQELVSKWCDDMEVAQATPRRR
jgi:hypothetical protein